MRGRWASAAIGAGVARRRAGAEMEQQDAAHQREMDQLKADQQRQIDELKTTTIKASTIIRSGRCNSETAKVSGS